MLWTDGDFVTSQDLITLDSEVQDVASAETITLDDPVTGNSVIHRAIEEAGDRLMKYMQIFGGYLNSGSVSANHYAAVMNLGQPSVNRSKILRGQIVVTDLSPYTWNVVKRWVAYWSLHVFFRDVANRTLKDRYRDKEERYSKESNTIHWDALRAAGIPTVRMPFPCPGAAWEPNAGLWSASNVTQVTGAGTQNGSYDVAVTWVDLMPGYYVSPTNNGNAESHPSASQTLALTSGNVIRVNIASLIPPNGSQHPATVPYAVVQYHAAGGWNVYAGVSGGPLYLQNSTPIPVGTKTYTLTGDPLASGSTLGQGQYADLYYSVPTGILQRG